MIQVTMLDGSAVSIDPSEFVRLRPASTLAETEADAASVLYATERMLLRDEPRSLADAFAAEIPVAEFTTPNGLPVFVAAAKVERILPPNAPDDHPQARAVVEIGATHQQVREDVAEATRRIEAALA